MAETPVAAMSFREQCEPYLNKWGPFRMTRDAITETAIRRFCEVAEDENPVYWDEEFAKRSRFGRIIAPPQSLFSMTFAAWWTPKHVQERLSEAIEELNRAEPEADAGGVLAVCDRFGYVVNTVAG
ncbi:MAG: MaoC family dehydratase, partial [bacterium]